MGGCVVYLNARGSQVQKPQGLGGLEFQNKALFGPFNPCRSLLSQEVGARHLFSWAAHRRETKAS